MPVCWWVNARLVGAERDEIRGKGCEPSVLALPAIGFGSYLVLRLQGVALLLGHGSDAVKDSSLALGTGTLENMSIFFVGLYRSEMSLFMVSSFFLTADP